jgi:hypothetical protein
MTRKWIIWLTLVTIFLVNQYLQRVAGIHIRFLYSYLDDLLAVPVTLGAYQLLMIYLRKDKNFIVSLPIVIICVVGFIFHFEILMPAISSKYTGDIWDPLMYTSGGIFYMLVMNKKQ